jgi:Lectin C-type domain
MTMDWDSASTFCVNRKMNLSTFDSNAEAKYFESVSTTNVWVGIRDFDNDGNFEKVTDKKSVESYLEWNANEPNRGGTPCVLSYVTAPFIGFNDNPCSTKYGLSCEYLETISG